VLAWWYGAAAFFYLVALRTTGDGWAYYYHGLSVAPACLLMGLGASPRLIGAVFAARRHEKQFRNSECGTRNEERATHGKEPAHAGEMRHMGWFPRLVLQTSAVLALGVLGFKAVHSIDLLPPRTGDADLYPRYTAAEHLAPQIPSTARVVTVGGPKTDETGQPVAYDDGTMIFYLDRKGFVIPREEASAATIRQLAPRGANYLVVKRGTPLAAEARRTFSVVDTFGDYQLFVIH
jgi:hypothetical protein